MFCHFDPNKAIQAAAVVMRHQGKRVSRLRLLKLLYIADRTALKDRGHPIIGGKIVAMPQGPLHSPVYDLIKGSHLAEPLWSRFVTADGPRDLILSEEPDVDLLSAYEVDVLNKVTDRHNEMDDYDLVTATHEFSEWQKHYNKGTSAPIPMESLVEAVCDPAEAGGVIQDLKEKAAIDAMYARAAS